MPEAHPGLVLAILLVLQVDAYASLRQRIPGGDPMTLSGFRCEFASQRVAPLRLTFSKP